MIDEKLYKLELHDNLRKCPMFYQNFEDSIRNKYPDWNSRMPLEIRSELRKANCRFYTIDKIMDIEDDGHYDEYDILGIVFDTPEDAAVFILGWS